MRLSEYVTASCWCERTEVEIPVSWVRAGLTDSCGPGCGPGCKMVAPDGEVDPYDEVESTTQKRWKMNKFDPARYDPADDSTPGMPRRPECVSLLVGENLCACGCGETPSGQKVKFKMGHDARLKGRLTRAEAAHASIALIEETSGAVTVVSPLEYADRFSTDKVDWRKLVSDGAAKIAIRVAPPAERRRASQRRVLERAYQENAVRVGKWPKVGDGLAALYHLPDGKWEVEFVDDDGSVRSIVTTAEEASAS